MPGEFSLDMSTPRRSASGRKLTNLEIHQLKPTWLSQWQEYTYLDSDMIDACVNKLHISPMTWPGNRIAEGCEKAVRKRFNRQKELWYRHNQGKVLTRAVSKELLQKAIKEANSQARVWAMGAGIPDPLGYEYELSKKERKFKRSRVWKPKLVTVAS